MSTHGAMRGDSAGNAVGNDAMSTSGDSVNQVPQQPPIEDISGSLAPQENVLPGLSTYGSAPLLGPVLSLGVNPDTQLVPSGTIDRTASIGGYDPVQSFGSY